MTQTQPPPGEPAGDRPVGDRIAKLLARAGIASRREVERMIVEGRIALDGVALDTPATILRSLAGVTVDGQPVGAPPPAQLFIYHKPPGLLVTEHDPAGRPTIYDRLPRDLPRLVPVGRLDLATEGLLLLTNDGGLKRQLELPATGVERTYRARTYGDVTQAMLEDLIEGIEIEGIRYGSIDANLERRTGANVWIELTLTEGKNREVRRVLEHLGLQVSRLIRTRYGPFVLGDLPPGEIGEVRQNDLVAFRQTLKPRRAKGADLEATVSVTPRAKPAPPPPPPPVETRAPRERPVAAAPARKPAQGGGWGTRVRPASAPVRASEPERRGGRVEGERSARPARHLRDDTATNHPGEGRESAGRPSRAAGQRSTSDVAPRDFPKQGRAAPATSRPQPDPGVRRGGERMGAGRTDRPDRSAFAATGRPSSDAGPRRGGERDARPDRAAGDRPARGAVPAKGPAGGRGHPPRAAAPGKGPAGGRGHPPRGGKSAPRKPSAPPRGGPRGGR